LQAVEGPAAERQTQPLGIGQGGGDDLGALLGRVGGRPTRSGPLLQPPEPFVVEAPDPGGGGGPRAAEARGDGSGGLSLCGGLDDPGAVDQAGGGGACLGERGEGLVFLGRQFAECDSGSHGHTSSGCTLCQKQITCRMHH
jgi:hypothetical protein